MSDIKPKEKYLIVHPKEDDGTEVKHSFILVLGRMKGDVISGSDDTVESRLVKALGTLSGIDTIQPNIGRYSMAATIARTFDADEVLEELRRRLDNDVLSEVIRPSQEIIVP